MLIRIVRMTFREEEKEAFLAIFRASREKILGCEGCRHVELLQDLHKPHVYSTYSLWDSEAHLNAYRGSAFFGKVWKATKALFAEKALAWSYVQVDTEVPGNTSS